MGVRPLIRKLIHRAKSLRKNQTEAERFLWTHLRTRQIGGYKFRRQQHVGCYIVDFVNLERKVVIELDGSQHSDISHQSYDSMRDEWLNREGYTILRIWDNEVFANLGGVLENIRQALLSPSPSPSPQGRGMNRSSRARNGSIRMHDADTND